MNCLFPDVHESDVTPGGKYDSKLNVKHDILGQVHKHLKSSLSSKSFTKNSNWMPRLSPSPMVIPFEEYDKMLNLQQALHFGITSILKLWWIGHPVVCSTLRIPNRLERILRSQNPIFGEAVELGCYRPDILYDESGTMKVCEINARFTVNGYFLSVFLAESALNGIFQPLISDEAPTIAPIPSTLAFPRMLALKIRSACSDLPKLVDGKITICCIRGREPGHDLDWLSLIMKDFHIHVIYASKDAFEMKDGSLFVGAEQVHFCVLELHQDELLGLSDEVLEAIMSLSIKGKCLNPLWSICLVHDKRLLSLLSRLPTLLRHTGLSTDHNDSLIKGSMNFFSTLRKHLIPTIAVDVEDIKMLLIGDDLTNSVLTGLVSSSLVVKPALLGKGEGILLQKDFSTDEEFLNAIEQEYSSLKHLLYDTSIDTKNKQLIVQPYLENQTCFRILDEQLEIDSSMWDVRNWRCVGTLLCMDDQFYGPGMFRFSAADLIALTRGGIAVAPVHLISNLPSRCIQRIAVFEEINSQEYQSNELDYFVGSELRKNLIKDGISILSSKVCNPIGNVSMGKVLESFLIEKWNARLREPAPGKGPVWTISPVNQGVARSHQAEEFETHTDASYEYNPPRYFALAVKSCDKKGGGRSGFARVRDAINMLTDDEFDVLSTTMVRWDVPIEFRKSCNNLAGGHLEEFIMAPVIMSRERARVRPDIMNVDHLSKDGKFSPYYKFKQAFARFYGILQRCCNDSNCLLPEGTVLFLDNQRFVHCRTAIQDNSRELIRIRFDLEDRPEIEEVCNLIKSRSVCRDQGLIQLIDCAIMKKRDLLSSIQNLFSDNGCDSKQTLPNFYHGKVGIYWSPSGGSTSSGELTTEQCAIPSLLLENDMMRQRLRDQLRQFGAFSKHSVVLNLMACGNLYRSMEIFHEIVVSIGGTDLPLGADADEKTIFQFIQHFRVDTICGWPSKLMKLIAYAKQESVGLERGNGSLLSLLKCVKTIVHGGELLNRSKRDVLVSVCGENLKLFGVFGSAEVGIFATTNGDPLQDDIYYVVPDTVHIELLHEKVGSSNERICEDSSFSSISPDDYLQEGTIVATNLIRKAIQPIIRFWMDDRAYWYRPSQKYLTSTTSDIGAVYGSCNCQNEQQVIRLTGRSGVSLAFPLGPTFLRWCDVKADILDLFEEALPACFIMGQMWILCGKDENKDCLVMRMVIDQNNAEDAENREIDKLAFTGLTRMRRLVKNVPNLECIAIQRVNSINQFAFNKRSNKQLYFVDNRNNSYGECNIVNLHWMECM